MKNASSEFLQLVHSTMSNERCSWDEAWRRVTTRNPDLHNQMVEAGKITRASVANSREAQRPKVSMGNERAKQLQDQVKALMDQGYPYDFAFDKASKQVGMATIGNTKPPQLSADGQRYIQSGPVEAHEAITMGLPLNADPEIVTIFRKADQVKMTPEIAAVVIRAIIQFAQRHLAQRFDQTVQTLKDKESELFDAYKGR